MPRYVAFLRAINVGGHTVKMDQLRELFESLGFSAVETFIASGNVIFETRAHAANLVAKIERRLHQALGYEVATFLRTDAEVAAIARYQPFPAPALKSAIALNVGLLATAPGPEAARTVARLRTTIDDFHLAGREVYWLCKKKQSESTFAGAVLERVLGLRATFRGMNTIARLTAKYPP